MTKVNFPQKYHDHVTETLTNEHRSSWYNRLNNETTKISGGRITSQYIEAYSNIIIFRKK
jgi:hypothetical protein